jgi:hypothetical protein
MDGLTIVGLAMQGVAYEEIGEAASVPAATYPVVHHLIFPLTARVTIFAISGSIFSVRAFKAREANGKELWVRAVHPHFDELNVSELYFKATRENPPQIAPVNVLQIYFWGPITSGIDYRQQTNKTVPILDQAGQISFLRKVTVLGDAPIPSDDEERADVLAWQHSSAKPPPWGGSWPPI